MSSFFNDLMLLHFSYIIAAVTMSLIYTGQYFFVRLIYLRTVSKLSMVLAKQLCHPINFFLAEHKDMRISSVIQTISVHIRSLL